MFAPHAARVERAAAADKISGPVFREDAAVPGAFPMCSARLVGGAAIKATVVDEPRAWGDQNGV